MPTCPVCSQDFNGLPTICPHCGHDFNNERRPNRWSGLGSALLSLGQLAAALACVWLLVVTVKSAHASGVDDVTISAFLGIFLSLALFVTFGRAKKT